MPVGPRNYVLFVEEPGGASPPRRLECDDLDAAERQGRALMLDGLRVSIEVRDDQALLYTLHL